MSVKSLAKVNQPINIPLMRLWNKGIVFLSRIKVYDNILFGLMKH